MGSLDLTIAIPVKNESKNLPGCLNSLDGIARQVVVIDSGSTDNTRKIAKEWGADVIDFEWNGQFPKKRNWYLRNHKPSTKWVLFLDADEYLTEDFRAALRAELPSTAKVGFWLHYTIYFLGKKLKGGYPLTKLALFQVGAGEYERIDEDRWSDMDMEIHEHPEIEGDVGEISAKIDHRDFRGMESYANKHNGYASWEASRYLKVMSDKKTQMNWTWKQKMKYRLMRTVWIGPIFFLGSFFLMGGFRDGRRGLAFAIMKMSYFTQIYCRIKELEQVKS